jgi:hypothetical protein
MSTLIFRYEGDGHKSKISPEGNLVAWGNTSLKIVDVANPSAMWIIGEGRHLRFLDNDRVVWLRNLTNTTADLYFDDLRFFGGGIKQLDVDPTLVVGNDFEASDGHWASVISATRRLSYDGQWRNQLTRAVRMCGPYMLVVESFGVNEYFVIYLHGQFVRQYPLPPTANEFKISEQGWISYGYYGDTYILTPGDGQSHRINLTAQEFVARIVHLPNGEIWAWTSTVIDNRPLVLGRPLQYVNGVYSSDENCVQLPFAAEGVDAQWREERQCFTVAGAANLGSTTPLEVHVVPHDYPRSALGVPPVEPPEPEMNKPGITVKDYSKILQNGVNTQVVYWTDRNNPGAEFRVHIINGSLKVEMTYDGWQTKSDMTGSPRPVTIRG